ncbi:MAG: hypothetical protein RLP96_00245, partial [Alphaproteobacteria bacterium]
YWLINAGWLVLGPLETWARLVPPLAAAASLVLTVALGRRLWPGETGRRAGAMAPLLALGLPLFALFATVVLFEMLLAVALLIGLLGLVAAARAPPWRGAWFTGWGLWALGLGLGVLAKGPVITLMLLPAALAGPLWAGRLADGPPHRSWLSWYGATGLAFAAGAGLALAWAIPAGLAGGPDYFNAILWGQTEGRITDSFAHRQPLWWYAALSPALFFPWLLWPPAWRALGRRCLWRDGGARLLAITGGGALLLFSAISGKQAYYIVPLMVPLALLLARALAGGAGDVRAGRVATVLPAVVLVALGLALLVADFQLMAASGTPYPWLPEWLFRGAFVAGWASLALAAALLFATRGSRRLQALALTLVGPAVLLILHLTILPQARPAYDTAPAARFLAAAEAAGRPIARLGEYTGEFHFPGRLTRPVAEVAEGDGLAWLAAHPGGLLVTMHRRAAEPPAEPLFRGRYRGRILEIWDADALAAAGLDP